jgi:hypothetical protein
MGHEALRRPLRPPEVAPRQAIAADVKLARHPCRQRIPQRSRTWAVLLETALPMGTVAAPAARESTRNQLLKVVFSVGP